MFALYSNTILFFSLYRRYTAFTPANPKRDQFVRYANSALEKQGLGGLVFSLSENMFKAILVEKNQRLPQERQLSVPNWNHSHQENEF